MSLLTVPSFKSTINSLKTVAAAVALSALAATPVLAQAAIQEPGAFAFYYPYRDVLNGGALTPAAKLASEPPAAMQAYVARESGIGSARTQRLPAYARGWPAPSRSVPQVLRRRSIYKG